MMQSSFGPKIQLEEDGWQHHTILPHPIQPFKYKWEDYKAPQSWQDAICRHPGHNFPSHLYIPAGKTHTHTCPGCGNQITLRNPVTW